MSDANKIIGIETKDINKIIGIEGKNIAKLGNIPVSFNQIPAGLIVFLNDTSIPSGWTRFSASDDRMIIGAGSSYSIGDTGGSKNISGSYNSSTNGSHTGVNHSGLSATGSSYTYRRGAAGDHAHILSNVQYTIPEKGSVLIKADAETDTLPNNTIVLSSSNLSGLNNITTYTDKYFIGKNNLSDISGAGGFNVASAGGHVHPNLGNIGPDTGIYQALILENTAGAHDHSVNITFNDGDVTDNLKKVLLSLWTHASEYFEPQEGMIGMWESLTPPDGWLLCDGTNGTPNLRDCFIKPVNSGNENITPSGDNTIGLNKSFSYSDYHNHTSGNLSPNFAAIANHATALWSHNHAFNENLAYLPPYYALSFIMKAA